MANEEQLQKQIDGQQKQIAALTKRCDEAEKTVENMSTLFAEFISTLDGRLEEIGSIFISKLEKKVPVSGE